MFYRAIVLATGAGFVDSGMAGEPVPVMNYDSFMSDEVGDTVVVLGGNAQAFDIALWLTVHKKKVVMVTGYANRDLDKQQSQHQRRFMLTSLYALGVKVWPEAYVCGFHEGGIDIQTAYGPTASIACDTVLYADGFMRNDMMLDQIECTEKYAIGDCSEPFNIGLAIRGGNDVGRAL